MAHVAPQSAIEAALRHEPGVLGACFRVAEAVAAEASLIAPKGPGAGRFAHGRSQSPDGTMASRINADHTSYGGRARSHADWSAPVEGGWGLYGANPHVLTFDPPITIMVKARGGLPGGRLVTTKKIKGHKPQPFMSEAAKAVAAASDRLTWHAHVPWRISSLIAP